MTTTVEVVAAVRARRDRSLILAALEDLGPSHLYQVAKYARRQKERLRDTLRTLVAEGVVELRYDGTTQVYGFPGTLEAYSVSRKAPPPKPRLALTWVSSTGMAWVGTCYCCPRGVGECAVYYGWRASGVMPSQVPCPQCRSPLSRVHKRCVEQVVELSLT